MNKKQFDKLPKPFRDKIKIDKGVENMRKRKVIDFDYGRHLVLQQLTFRLRCIDFLRKKGQGNA